MSSKKAKGKQTQATNQNKKETKTINENAGEDQISAKIEDLLSNTGIELDYIKKIKDIEEAQKLAKELSVKLYNLFNYHYYHPDNQSYDYEYIVLVEAASTIDYAFFTKGCNRLLKGDNYFSYYKDAGDFRFIFNVWQIKISS